MPSDIAWYGDNPNKGLGVLAYGDYKLRIMRRHNPAFKTIVPIAVTGGGIDFTLFAIWANNPADKGHEYVGQIWKAVQQYEKLIRRKRTVLAGDFNSNSIWDKPRRVGNHTALVELLGKKKISSVYHQHFGHPHGQEEHATFNLYKNVSKPYHLDYCFASKDLTSKLSRVEILNFEPGQIHSDHMPLIVDFDLEN